MKILFISRRFQEKTGGKIVSERNLKLLKQYSKGNLIHIEVPPPNMLVRIKNLLFTQSYGDNKYLRKQIEQEKEIDLVFIDGSLYGGYASFFKKKELPIVIFFHNIESVYFLEKFRCSKNPIDLIYAWYSRRIEKRALLHSSHSIVLNYRDYDMLLQKYQHKADLILPVSLPIPKKKENAYPTPLNEKYCLFVGSDFFANTHGILWFIKNVLPNIDCNLVIGGSCCNTLKETCGNNPKVHLLGFIENLMPIYQNASMVVLPIFSGSGMKVKSIEALSYGKSLIGTKEAFEGIETDISKIGALCNNVQDFISAINLFLEQDKLFNVASFSLFNDSYSDNAIAERFNSFIRNIFSSTI